MPKLFSKSEQEKVGHCSWCFKSCPHQLVTEGIALQRGEYQCEGCKRETLPCSTRRCEDFARAVPGIREKECYVHRKIIKSWDDKEAIDMLSPTGYCSYCFENAEQRAITVTSKKAGWTYECMSCHQATAPCQKGCEIGFARAEKKECSKCRGDIADWANVEENRESTRVTKFCSCCLNESKHALVDSSKNVYQCLACYSTTKPCSKCGDCMEVSKTCVKCKLSSSSDWEELMKKKKDRDEKCKTVGYYAEEVQRPSEYRSKAFVEGTIRPFLLLVSMQPQLRAYVGMCLGIVFSAEDNFLENALDAHAEAWTILDHSKLGIQVRVMGARETIKKVNVDWYEILHRIMKELIPQEKWVELPKDTRHASVTPGNEDMIHLQTMLVQHYVDRQLATFSDVAKQNFELLMQGKEFAHFRKVLQDSIHYRPEMDLYSNLQLCQAFMQSKFYSRDALLSMQEVAASTILADYAGVEVKKKTDKNDQSFISSSQAAKNKATEVAGNIGMKTLASAINPVLGMAVLASNIGGVLYGESKDIVLTPVRDIVFQEALLLARGIQIDSYLEV